MERRRTWSRRLSSEEEEEEDADRRTSTRNRKRVRYMEDEEDEDYEEDEDDDDGLGPSTQTNHNQRAQDNSPLAIMSLIGLLPVTCGSKMGILDVEKLDRGKECIMCEDRWFTPTGFEDFGGKSSNKKWKTSILYENKPLQFWFEQGSLTTTGYKRRGNEATKKKKVLASNCTSESSSEESEIQLGEETEEDDVKDEDWLPDSEELALRKEEREEEKAEAESRGEVVDSNEREAELAVSVLKRTVLQKEVKVLVERLPQTKTDCQFDCADHPERDDGCNPLDADEEEGEQNSAATHFEPSQTSLPPGGGGVEGHNRGEFAESNESEEHERREIRTETGNSPTLVSAPATSQPDIKSTILNKTEFMESTSDHSDGLLSPPPTVTVVFFGGNMIDDMEATNKETGHCGEEEEARDRTETVPGMQRQWINRFEYSENAAEHLDASRSTPGSRASASPMLRVIKEESVEATSGGPPTEEVEGKYENTDGSTSGRDAAQLHAVSRDKSVRLTIQTSGGPQSSDKKEEGLPLGLCDLDTMDLDQLRREKLKMQLKVLRLQEEYYTQKIKGGKK